MNNNNGGGSGDHKKKRRRYWKKKQQAQQPSQPVLGQQGRQQQNQQSHPQSNQQHQAKPQNQQQKNQHSTRWKKPVYFAGRGSAALSRGERPRSENVHYVEPLQKFPLLPAFAEMFRGREINAALISSKIKDIVRKKTVSIEPGRYLWLIENARQFQYLYELLMHVEEAQMKIDIRLYDIKNAKLLPFEHSKYYLYKVFVPGLAEKRPSILRGDSVYAHDAVQGRHHKGYAHFINLDNVLISFCSRSIRKQKYDLEFTFNRTPIRVMHRAISDIDVISRLFQPTAESYGRPYSALKLYNPVMNEEQQQAISTVLRKPSRIVIIHGPPGTGKTSTLVEMMTQILAGQAGARILACSSSNEAADLMCKRLCSFIDHRYFLRLNAMSRNPNDISDPSLLACSNLEGSSFDIPPLSTIMQKSAVFTTCITAGKLLGMGVPKDHFTHVIIDEAGEALVPETLVPLQLSTKAVIVIAGDSKQLGPVIRSHIAMEYRFDISLLEYITDICKVSNKTVFHLKKTYRSHPAIVDLYSTMFYNKELEPKAPPQKTNAILQWYRFRSSRNQTPILVKHHEGKDKRDHDSPSWYNEEEINLIVTMINELLEERLVYPHQISIITPYRKQVQKFKLALRHGFYNGIEVGTVEHFQGKENTVIFISTVRSESQNVNKDKKFKLGFLDNPKRLNVAISRAIAGLVIVGNMKILSLDEKWKELISMAMRKQAYSGPTFTQIAQAQQAKSFVSGISAKAKGVVNNTDAPWKDRE